PAAGDGTGAARAGLIHAQHAVAADRAADAGGGPADCRTRRQPAGVVDGSDGGGEGVSGPRGTGAEEPRDRGPAAKGGRGRPVGAGSDTGDRGDVPAGGGPDRCAGGAGGAGGGGGTHSR